MNRFVTSFVTVSAALVALACGSDENKDQTGNKDAGVTGSGGSSSGNGVPPNADGTCPADHPVFDGVNSCLDQMTATQMCKDQSVASAPGTNVSDPTCSAGCTCLYCAESMFLCGQHPDCVRILECAQENNCLGVDCYTSGACTSLIDHADGDAGITSDSVLYAQMVNACATKVAFTPYDYTNREGPTCAAGCP